MTTKNEKPILCLDFDGVIHSYTSPWKGAENILDPPTEGAMRFIWDAYDHFKIVIYSSRSGSLGGTFAMKQWLCQHFREYWAADRTHCDDILAEIEWAAKKPAAFLTIDDRAMLFTGIWPDPQELLKFKPWNKREPGPIQPLIEQVPVHKVREVLNNISAAIKPYGLIIVHDPYGNYSVEQISK